MERKTVVEQFEEALDAALKEYPKGPWAKIASKIRHLHQGRLPHLKAIIEQRLQEKK